MEPAQRATYPNLAIMALDMLSIPAMSDEPSVASSVSVIAPLQ
jgi:hAT family C-terminal dimerisation region